MTAYNSVDVEVTLRTRTCRLSCLLPYNVDMCHMHGKRDVILGQQQQQQQQYVNSWRHHVDVLSS